MSTTETVPRQPVYQYRTYAILERITSNFWLQRLIKAIFSIWLVTTITFFVIRAMPGNAVDILIQDLTSAGMSPDDAKNQAAALLNLDLDKPVVLQYVDYLGNVLRGDLGTSYKSRGLKVTELIVEVLPWTVFSVGLSLLITFTFGIALGALMAYKRDTWIDHLLSNFAAAVNATQPVLIGLLATLVLGVLWKPDGQHAIVPITDMRGALSPGIQPGFTLEFFADVFKHVRVLLLVYVLAYIGSWMLQMKSNTVSVLGEDYVTVARARGLGDWRILTAYVGRNATLPLVTRLAISIGFAMGGSILLENLFTYRGIGFQLADALAKRDYPIMQGVFLVTTAAVIFANLLADYLYGWLDPRIRIAGGGQ